MFLVMISLFLLYKRIDFGAIDGIRVVFRFERFEFE